MTLPCGVSESTFVKIRGGSLLTDRLQDAGRGQKTTDKCDFCFKRCQGQVAKPRAGVKGCTSLKFPPAQSAWEFGVGKDEKNQSPHQSRDAMGQLLFSLLMLTRTGLPRETALTTLLDVLAGSPLLPLCSHLIAPRALSLCLRDSPGPP